VQACVTIFARANISVKIARAIIEGIFNMAKNYGKSGQEENQCHSSTGGRGLGSVGGQSQSDGNEVKDGVAQGDCTGIYRDEKSPVNRGKANFGKILSQLRELQRSHLAYVESHEERLQARLNAAKEHHTEILNQMKLLEQEILCLLGEAV
jgi:hypothetical protein